MIYMEKEKNKKKMNPKLFSAIMAVVVVLLGIFLLWKISDNFFGALSEKDEMVSPSVQGLESEPMDVNELVNEVTGESGVPEEDPAGGQLPSDSDPAETYLAMRDELVKIEKAEEIIAIAEKYGTEKNIAYAKQIGTIKMIIGEEEIMSAVSVAVDEKIKSAETVSVSGNKATVKLTAESGEEGEAIMLFERGGWKFDSEKW